MPHPLPLFLHSGMLRAYKPLINGWIRIYTPGFDSRRLHQSMPCRIRTKNVRYGIFCRNTVVLKGLRRFVKNAPVESWTGWDKSWTGKGTSRTPRLATLPPLRTPTSGAKKPSSSLIQPPRARQLCPASSSNLPLERKCPTKPTP